MSRSHSDLNLRAIERAHALLNPRFQLAYRFGGCAFRNAYWQYDLDCALWMHGYPHATSAL